jgi:RNA polymerase sigma-70 factor (ECF subfamily)
MEDWQQIVAEFGPVVWKTVYRLVPNHADAADCFQEVFAGALELAKRQRVERWAGLLVKMATARALDLIRRRMRHPGHSLEMDRLPAKQKSPQENAEGAELSESLRAALAELPEQQSEVFCLRHLNEMSYEEIANEIGVSIDNVGVMLHRAKARLREVISEMQSGKGMTMPR